MKIRNTEIAKMVAKNNYNYREVLDGIDAGRTPEQEEEEISEKELEEMIEAICLSFDIRKEEALWKGGKEG